MIFLGYDAYHNVFEILRRYSDKKLSFADAFLINTSESYKINNLASYDERSFAGIIKNIIGKNYAKTLKDDEVERIMKLQAQNSS